ncbi:MAG: glutaredoxin domain-containing protein [Myxococcales bacterium]
MTETGRSEVAEVAEVTARVTVFSTTYCGWCRRAEQLLQREGIPFAAVDVTGDADARAELVDRSGGRQTVPVIFLDDQPIGGYQELARLLATGGLDHLKG